MRKNIVVNPIVVTLIGIQVTLLLAPHYSEGNVASSVAISQIVCNDGEKL